jgi:hypothetical protein
MWQKIRNKKTEIFFTVKKRVEKNKKIIKKIQYNIK